MPLKFLPDSLTNCLGLSCTDAPSRSSSPDSPMAAAMSRVANARASHRVSSAPNLAGNVPAAPACAAPGSAGREVAPRPPGAAPAIDLTAPIPIWGHDDPTPDWANARVAQAWAARYGVNTTNLIRVDGQCTRYGLIELGGHTFIAGPTATPAEADTLTRMLKANPRIGAICCVEPGAMRVDADSVRSADHAGYRQRPVSTYIARVAARGGDARPPSAELEGSLAHVSFMEFVGMERRGAGISGRTFWDAGRGVADYLRRHPGRIALVCSEHGIARPCAVIASAALQLQGGDARLRGMISGAVASQRAELSSHYIDAAARSFDLIAELALLVDMLRTSGRGDMHRERKAHLLLQHLRTLPEVAGAHIDWRSARGRQKLAAILEANFEHVAPLLASGCLPPGKALLWLREEINVLSGIRFLSPCYVSGHTDRISLEPIDPRSPDAVRLVSLDDYGLTCDNKYYDAGVVASWHRTCFARQDVMSHPTQRTPVVALLVHASERERLALAFRSAPA